VPETKISLQGRGKQFMSKGFNKVGTNGNGSNGSNGSATAALVNVTETAVIEEAVVVEEVKEEVKTPPPPPAPVIKPVPVLTLEQKLERVDELNRIIAKYHRLQEARKNLNTFKVGSDGLNLTIIIKDASGQEFKTSHNIVVETVLKTVKDVLDSKIQEVEDQINFIV